MACPRCGSAAPAVDGRCPVCRTVDFDGPTVAPGTMAPLGGDASPAGGGDATGFSAATTAAATPPHTAPPAEPPRSSFGRDPVGPLRIGENFGTRYHLIKLLGLGGMGAVYQAWDQVLEVAVALKVIRHDATDNPSVAEELSRRFKRELLLARQITHKNVVRIHDLGEVDGTQYISMPYVHGSDLASVIRREGRLSVERAIAIAKEVASGLAAAHEAGVIHRDLKPANIMIDAEGSALIMDFGIARSTSATGFGATAAGVVVGTIEYMAPEQARGESVDQRADIYAFGLILNDALLGRRQGGAIGVAELLARMAQAPVSMHSIDPTIPTGIDAIVTRCVQVDPAARYQTMRELLAGLDTLDRTGHAAHKPPSAPAAAARRMPAWAWAAVVALIALGGTGWVLRDRLVRPQAAVVSGPPMSLAILPFRNASGDQSLDSLGASVSEVLRTELGQSSGVRTVPSDRLHQVMTDLRISSTATLAPTELARVAEFTSARSVLWGQITRFGNAIRIDATLQDLDRDQTTPLNAMAPNENGLVTAITQLAATVQQHLARGLSDVLNELKSTAWRPSTSSFEALRFYNEAQQLRQQGDYQGALRKFEASTKADGNFALAFSGLASTYATLGYDSEAGQFSRRAVSLSDALPAQEKYLIAATHFQVLNDTKKAIEAYENLAKASPNNVMVQFEVGGLYEASGDYDRAKQSFEKVVLLDPKFSEGLLALGRVDIKRGHPEESLERLNAALTLAIQFNHDEARGNILQAIGVAYKRMGRPQEALRRYEESLDVKRRIGDKRGMAASLSEIGQIHESVDPRKAEQEFREAMTLQREIGDKTGLGSSLINLGLLLNESLGRPDDALPLFREALQLRRDSGDQHGEALVVNNIGNVYLAKGDYSEAQTYFERALESREKSKIPDELADTLHNLGETLAKRGRYDQSLAQYVRALDLRRSAGDQRSAAIESYSIGTIFDYQGRFGAAVKSKEEALTTFRELQQRDVWLGEILSGYGNSLALSGRMDEAKKQLDEAMEVANELKNPLLVAQTSRFAADRLVYMGDMKGAARQADEALRAASRAADKSMLLLAQATAAIAAAGALPANSRALASQFATIARDGDVLGLQFLSVDSAIRRAELLLKMGDRAGARQEIDRALARAETLGLRRLLADAHFVRGEVLRTAGDAEARRDYASALRLLDEMKAEDGSHDLLKRADLAAIYEQSTRFARE